MSANIKSMKNRFVPKGDAGTIVSSFVIIAGVVLTAMSLPASELIIGAGVGYLFGRKQS